MIRIILLWIIGLLIFFIPLYIWIFAIQKWKETATAKSNFREFLIQSIVWSAIGTILVLFIAFTAFPSRGGDYSNNALLLVFVPPFVIWGIFFIRGLIFYFQALANRDK